MLRNVPSAQFRGLTPARKSSSSVSDALFWCQILWKDVHSCGRIPTRTKFKKACLFNGLINDLLPSMWLNSVDLCSYARFGSCTSCTPLDTVFPLTHGSLNTLACMLRHTELLPAFSHTICIPFLCFCIALLHSPLRPQLRYYQLEVATDHSLDSSFLLLLLRTRQVLLPNAYYDLSKH